MTLPLLLAIETNKYGWFWDCPNGGDKCHYRHALPPGFVLKKDKKREKKEDITIEELVEIERAKLGYNLAKITLESFLVWKKKKIAEKQAKDLKETDRKKAEFRAGKNVGLSGREMFTFNPELARDNEMDEGEAAMDIVREQDDDDDQTEVKEINIDLIVNEAKEADGSGTVCTEMTRQYAATTTAPEAGTSSDDGRTGEDHGEGPSTATAESNGDIIDEPIDESLFAEDDELDDLENELHSVKLNA